MTISPLPILKDKKAFLFLVLIAFPLILFSQEDKLKKGKLIITFTDIRNETGSIQMGLYNNARQWTDNPFQHYSWKKTGMRYGALTVVIDSLQFGKYACAVLDDEDNSVSMEFILGLPAEGWGMSANPSFLKLKKPGFEEVAFDLDSPQVEFEIKINYLNKNRNAKLNCK